MPRKKPVIQEKAVIARVAKVNPVGEAPKCGEPVPASPMTEFEREDMVSRLEESITKLINDAEKTYQANRYKPGTTDIDPDYITRLSTNEFFFYTKEPLTLSEFEDLQDQIARKAGNLSPGVQLILGSFAVKTDKDQVMNVTTHITCGQPAAFQFIVKNYTSSIDVRYKITDKLGNTNTLAVFDKRTHNSSISMPGIIINGVPMNFSFNNIVSCKTPGGTPFITAVDICIDHAYGVAKDNFEAFAKFTPAILKQPISHVVVSNSISIDKTMCLGSAVMHIDPYNSPKKCKAGISQQKSAWQKLVFGNDPFRIFEIAREEIDFLIEDVKNKYAYKTSEPSAGRDHKSYTASLSNINFQKSQTTSEFTEFKKQYHTLKGDRLKTQILENIEEQINETTSSQELNELKEKFKTSYEYDALKTEQGWLTQKLGLKTSSIKALEKMLEQRENQLSAREPKSSI